jgi:hypothetical protein
MATAVTIQILVDSDQAQEKVKNLTDDLKRSAIAAEQAFQKAGEGVKKLEDESATAGQAVKKAADEITKAGEGAKQAQQKLNDLTGELKGSGIAGEQAFQKASESVKKLEDQSISAGQAIQKAGQDFTMAGAGVKQLGVHAATSLDAVRLLSQEFGLRLPRAAEQSSQKAGEGVRKLGSQSTAAGQAVKKAGEDIATAGVGVKQLGGHAATSLDSVRLLSQEFGLRLPRAIEAMLSRMPEVTQALSSMLGVMAGIAAAQVFVHVGEDIAKLYTQYISLNAAADKFYETLKKTAQEDVANTRSLETTRRRTGDAESGYANYNGAARALHDQGMSMLASNPAAALSMLLAAKTAADAGVESAGNMVKLGKSDLDQVHQKALAQIDLNHAMDATLTGAQKINAEAAKKKEINEENRVFDRKQEMYYGNASPADAGVGEESIKNQTADAEAAAQRTVLGRNTALALMKSNDEIVQARLSGDELYLRKYQDIGREMTLSMQNEGKSQVEISAAVAAARIKLDDEVASKWLESFNRTQEASRNARIGGLTGAARVEGEFNNRLDTINTSGSPGAAQERLAAKQEELQKLKDLQDKYDQADRADIEQRTAVELGAYAKIEAEAQKAIDAKKAAFSESHLNGGTAADQDGLGRSLQAIRDEADSRKRQLTQANNATDLQYAQEAAKAEARVKEEGILGWVAQYKNAIAEINEQDAQRTAKMEEEAAKQGATQQEIAARKVDIDRAANAQIDQQNLQLQHQIAGNLESAFKDPVGYIKSAMEKMFFEIVASWVMRMDLFKNVFGQTMGGLQPGGGGGASSAGNMLQKVLGIGGGSAGASSTTNSGGGGYSSSSTTPGLGGTYGGSTGASIPGSIGGVASLASQIGTSGLFGGSGGGSSAGAGFGQMPIDDSGRPQPMIDILPAPGVSPTLANVGGFGPATTTDSVSATASAAMGVVGAGMAGYNAFNTTTAAYESGNILQGALGDAASGAAIGGIVGGPLGAGIGAAIGAGVGAAAAVAGMVGDEGKKLGARNYYNSSVFPTLAADEHNTNYGDFQSAISGVDQTSANAMQYMRAKFGGEAADWVDNNYMKKEVLKITSMIANSAEGGRQYTTMSAKQFHSGGQITGFGDFSTSSTEGYIHAMRGETVMNPAASLSHAAALRAMNAGASAADIASSYLSSSSRSSPAQSGGGDTHFHVHTLDTKTMSTWLRNGGAKLITNHQNQYTAQYAGDGIG